MMKQLTISESFYRGGVLVKVYTNDEYHVLINNEKEIEVRGFKKYLPKITEVTEVGAFNKSGKFEIQTTSYGALEPQEIEKVIEGYQIALATVQQIEDLLNEIPDLYEIKMFKDCWGGESYFGLINGKVVTEAHDCIEDLKEIDPRFVGVKVVE